MRSAHALICLAFIGCGPLTHPMVERLDPETQAQVDSSWANMLSPPDRLDRDLLLDVLIAFQAHQRGVDRLQLTSEKAVPGGLVVMTISFDRLQPDADQFAMVYYDAYGTELRREAYTRADVDARLDVLYGPLPTEEVMGEDGKIHMQPSEEAQAERAARLRAIRAATQPAGAEIDDGGELVAPLAN